MAAYKKKGFSIGILVFLFMQFSPAPSGLNDVGWDVAAVAVLMAIWWATETVPVAITALLPLALFPLLGVTSFDNAALPYANKNIYLFLGGFMLALGIESSGLHKRIALKMIIAVGSSGRKLVGGFMLVAALISMWVMNTSTTLMLLPIGLAVCTVMSETIPGLSYKDKSNFDTALLLGIAYAATIGGMSTLIGTAPNIVFSAFMQDTYGVEISMFDWMMLGVPLASIMLIGAWILLTKYVFPISFTASTEARNELKTMLIKMGDFSKDEKRISVIFGIAVFAWVFRTLLNKIEFLSGLTDAGIAIIAAILIFMTPSASKKGDLLQWERSKDLPWGLLILFGGGLSLAAQISSSGLGIWIGNSLLILSSVPPILLILAVATLIIFLTEITSNVTTTTTFLPVFGALAIAIGILPVSLTVPVCLAASCAFMLPVATPPNAIVYGSNKFTIATMMRAGFALNIVGILVVTIFAYYFAPLVFKAVKYLLSTFLFVSFLNSTDYIDYLHPFHPTKSDSGMVVSQNALSSDIGVKILDMGGNAVDAAVAVGFSLATTLPRAGNLGGGGFMLIYIKEKNEIFYIDYRSKSPKNASIKKLLGTEIIPERNSKLWERVDYTYLASGVPGTVYGLLEAHKNFGKLDLETIMKPVIEQAEKGIVVTSDLSYVIRVTPQLRTDKESYSIFFNDGDPLEEFSVMKRPDLANTFKEISKNGAKGFYEGQIADKIVDAMRENNGLITHDDLKNYKAFFRMPIAINYKGHKVYTAAPPSGGGITLLTALGILNNIDIKKYKSDSTKTYHFLAESLRRGHNNRSHYVGDPEYFDVPISELLSSKRLKELYRSIDSDKASPPSKVKPFKSRNESKDTTHYSIIDKEGNAVSNTYTLGLSFGSGVTIPGTGILMNSQMNNFAYRYGDKNEIGRAASPGNRFEPGKKPMSTMAPTMVFDKDNKLFLITGSPGGSDIPAAILRVITGVIDFNLDIGEATMLPRIHKDWPYSGLEHERAVSRDIVRRLKSMGHETEYEMTIGSTQSIHVVDGVNTGFADLRRPNAGVSAQSN